jgi:hypothetical protein
MISSQSRDSTETTRAAQTFALDAPVQQVPVQQPAMINKWQKHTGVSGTFSCLQRQRNETLTSREKTESDKPLLFFSIQMLRLTCKNSIFRLVRFKVNFCMRIAQRHSTYLQNAGPCKVGYRAKSKVRKRVSTMRSSRLHTCRFRERDTHHCKVWKS